jgi:acyl-CoA synthetase (AMP-forming)/AMP-acid ligase II
MEDYGLLVGQERPTVPGGGPQSVADLVSRYDDPRREALVGFTRSWTAEELERDVDAAAAVYQSLGLLPGDRVAATGPSDAYIVIAFLGAQRAGLVWVGINRMLAAPEKRFLVEDSEASLLLGDSESLEQCAAPTSAGLRLIRIDGEANDAWPALVVAKRGASRPTVNIDPFAPAAIAYTSGTTGVPKGAVHSQHNMIVISTAGHELIGVGNWERGLRRSMNIPLTLLNLMVYGPIGALVGQGTFICMERFDVLSTVRTIEEKRIEMLGTSPTTVYDLVNRPEFAGRRLRHLRYVFAGGAFVAEELKDRFREIYGVELVEDYGLTEAPTSIVSGRVNERALPGSIGRMHPHLQVAALDGEDRILPYGEVGEIAARAVRSGAWAGVYTTMLGYWKRPEETRETLRGGWLHTGDLGRIDDQGRVFIVGRQKDTILRAGANVYPAEIERLLRTDPRVEDAVVLGLPDARLGEIAAAYFQLKETETDASAVKAGLLMLCQRELARYKVPERWFVVCEIPRNQMRKPMKNELRDGPATPL